MSNYFQQREDAIRAARERALAYGREVIEAETKFGRDSDRAKDARTREEFAWESYYELLHNVQ